MVFVHTGQSKTTPSSVMRLTTMAKKWHHTYLVGSLCIRTNVFAVFAKVCETLQDTRSDRVGFSV